MEYIPWGRTLGRFSLAVDTFATQCPEQDIGLTFFDHATQFRTRECQLPCRSQHEMFLTLRSISTPNPKSDNAGVGMVQVAERMVTADLECLISRTVNSGEADYAVVSGVQARVTDGTVHLVTSLLDTNEQADSRFAHHQCSDAGQHVLTCQAAMIWWSLSLWPSHATMLALLCL